MKNDKKIILLVFLLSTLIFCAGCKNKSRVCYKEKCFSVELAVTEAERERGLQDRKSLPENAGMLFLFDGKTPEKFWMKKTLIPLDMIWLDFSGKVMAIEHEAQPCANLDVCTVYGPDEAAAAVLELNAGQANKIGLKDGETLELQIER